jgi:HEAT repeat protein
MKIYSSIIFCCLIAAQSAQSSEPTYNGKALSEWLLDLKTGPTSDELQQPLDLEQVKQVQEKLVERDKDAVRQIGTNGIPTLLDMLGAKERNKKRVLSKLNNVELKVEFSSKDSNLADLRNLAVDGFGILGTNAESAVPQITKLFHDPETRFEATRALTEVGPAGFSVLTNALASKDSSVRNPVIWVLGQKGGGDPKVINQLLINALKDSDAVNQGNAATFLAGKDPAIAVPALIELLSEDPTNYLTVRGAARALSSYGSAAKNAAPILLSIYTNTWDVQLMWALKAIDIETAAKAEAFLVNSGPLSSARQGYTETLLPNGIELIAGGSIHTEIPTVKNRYLSSAELLDPATGKWSETGSMNTAREFHTATLLHNGKVLVAGGDAGSMLNSFLSAELYDPTTGRWTETGLMNSAHPNENAVLQSDGKVRVSGWAGDKRPNDDLYDPTTEKWTVITNK